MLSTAGRKRALAVAPLALLLCIGAIRPASASAKGPPAKQSKKSFSLGFAGAGKA